MAGSSFILTNCFLLVDYRMDLVDGKFCLYYETVVCEPPTEM